MAQEFPVMKKGKLLCQVNSCSTSLSGLDKHTAGKSEDDHLTSLWLEFWPVPVLMPLWKALLNGIIRELCDNVLSIDVLHTL